ncbi:MAG: type I pantothenate kinase [Microbacteriaceae bacterium]|jgi:type I pantothenate kinase|nr:type I pantothenate kinase [Microbacteriaceae bacterium]
MARPPSADENGSPFVEYDRQTWAELAPKAPLPLSDADIERVRSVGDMLDASEVVEVYQPLARLLALYVEGARHLHSLTRQFLGDDVSHTPFVIGVAGSVAVGKSTTSRVLQELLSRNPETPNVALVATDGFLLPLAELRKRNLLERKGFPESYDTRALLRFVSQIKSGVSSIAAPVYSHLSYDRVPDEVLDITQPDILIIEGLNVLAPPATSSALAVSDLFDFGIYVDARTPDIARWYEDRFLQLQQGAFQNPESYFHRYASLDEDDARAEAQRIWSTINEPNLIDNILPTKPRASLILQKEADHRIHKVLLRKI